MLSKDVEMGLRLSSESRIASSNLIMLAQGLLTDTALETCPQAKTSKSGRPIFFLFFRRVRATFWTFSPVSVKT